MSPDLLEFINDPKSKGTIVIAIGTISEWYFAPKQLLDTFASVLNQFVDYRIIWSIKNVSLTMGPHVKLIKWVPQKALLSHNKTKLFISHGGLKRFDFNTKCSKIY